MKVWIHWILTEIDVHAVDNVYTLHVYIQWMMTAMCGKRVFPLSLTSILRANVWKMTLICLNSFDTDHSSYAVNYNYNILGRSTFRITTATRGICFSRINYRQVRCPKHIHSTYIVHNTYTIHIQYRSNVQGSILVTWGSTLRTLPSHGTYLRTWSELKEPDQPSARMSEIIWLALQYTSSG